MKTPRKANPLAGYSPKMDKAIKKLQLAVTYAEDGAQLDAARCAAEAMVLLFQAHQQRAAFLAEQQEHA